MDAFTKIFESLDDPRTGNAKQHDLNEILLIALCTVAKRALTWPCSVGQKHLFSRLS
jgi:hypothetical protein